MGEEGGKSGTFSTHLRSYNIISEIFQASRDGTSVQPYTFMQVSVTFTCSKGYSMA